MSKVKVLSDYVEVNIYIYILSDYVEVNKNPFAKNYILKSLWHLKWLIRKEGREICPGFDFLWEMTETLIYNLYTVFNTIPTIV